MRPDPNDPNKVAIIIYCVKNYVKLGYPDTPQNWSLKDNKGKVEGIAPTKICPICKSKVLNVVEICPHCGFKFVDDLQIIGVNTAEQIYSSDNNFIPNTGSPSVIHATNFKERFEHFVEIGEFSDKINKPQKWAAYQMLQSVHSFDDLITLRKLGGMKYGWEFHQAEALHIPIPKNKKSLQKNPSNVTI